MTEPSEALDHLDKQSELNADSPQFVALNRLVFSLIESRVLQEGASDNQNVLDFGCGPGRLSVLLAQSPKVASVVGTDISDGMISRAKEHAAKLPTKPNNLTFVQQTARLPKAELEPMTGQKDLVVMSFVLGHIAPKEAGIDVLALAASTLKPGGHFALAEFEFKSEGHDDSLADGNKHSHGHHHHHHHHGHHHYQTENTDSPSQQNGHHRHHGGHVAFSQDEIRKIFYDCGLEPDKEFVPFEFEWQGRTIQSIMAIGTKI